jgi:predicted metal-dependent phosphoesterase TrpH
MTPRKIVQRAQERNLAMIAITDHNSAENTLATLRAARETGLCVIPGMEISTAEEAHILALFEHIEDVLSLQQVVYERLLPGENDEDLFGLQVVANELDEVEGMNRRLLIGATSLSVEELIKEIHQRNGLAVASHIDRMSFSVVGQLGFIPEELDLDAVEISGKMTLPEARARFPEYQRRPFLTASDAHDLEDLGRTPTRLRVAGPGIAELRLALARQEGREILETAPDL